MYPVEIFFGVCCLLRYKFKDLMFTDLLLRLYTMDMRTFINHISYFLIFSIYWAHFCKTYFSNSFNAPKWKILAFLN